MLIVVVTAVSLFVLAAVFLGLFFLPGLLHWLRLWQIWQRLQRLDGRNHPSELRKIFAADPEISHVWKEYSDSLHKVREEWDGQPKIIGYRSTVPAETYFNTQSVVDSRLGTEFFKHLPGIFTGIGIIGTFFGLIDGLEKFNPSDPEKMQEGLKALTKSVGDAFNVSAAAISLAMIVTFLEKLLLSSLYRITDEICNFIDAQFESGAGEEYLARLVKASEESANQSKILKDALIHDLKNILRELTITQIKVTREYNVQLLDHQKEFIRQQIEATEKSGTGISHSIDRSLQVNLKSSLDALTVAVSSHQSQGVTTDMLGEVMSGFGNRISETLEKMNTRQEIINAQHQAFIENLRHRVAVQTEAHQRLQTSLGDLTPTTSTPTSVAASERSKA
jgi:hypothetical protein